MDSCIRPCLTTGYDTYTTLVQSYTNYKSNQHFILIDLHISFHSGSENGQHTSPFSMQHVQLNFPGGGVN